MEATSSRSYEIMNSAISPGGMTTSPPQLPPKRKMEGEQAPYKRGSPGPVRQDSGGLGVMMHEETNNPWKQSMARISTPGNEILVGGRRGSTPRIDTQSGFGFAPLIDFESTTTIIATSQPRGTTPFSVGDRMIRRKPVKFVTPSPVTEEPPKQLPTPPPAEHARARPVSHLLHLPNMAPANAKLQPPLLKDEEAIDAFYISALERHRKLIRSEASAGSDEKRVKMWVDFVVRECQLREERYPVAVKKMKVGIMGQLGKAFSAPGRPTQELSPISPVLRGMDGEDVEMGNSEEANRKNRPDSQWWGQYANNSTFDNNNSPAALEARIRDEESSRGRTSSRWWEASIEGGSRADSDHFAVRSDGMGDEELGYGRNRYSRAPRASLREIAEHATSSRNPGDYMGSSAYPPDRKYSRSRSRPAASRTRSTPARPVKTSLDIAPLLTLLPSFPPEYPAVNNAHPQLAVFRNLVRTLNDLSAVNEVKSGFNAASTARKEALAIEALKRRNQHSEYIQQLYATTGNSSGNGPSKRFSFGQLESLNSDFQAREDLLSEESLKTEFDLFQSDVVDVTHSELQERTTAASAAYSDLVKAIKFSADAPRGGQEEGHEVPELLEKLTCLKWLFDVREQLHREMFDLLAERNRRYKEVVITPFFVSRQADKIREADDFFMRDEMTRRLAADKESHVRYGGFLDIVESNVVKGVEKQISAFWEVAPLINECFEKIPVDLTNVHPIVPPEEFHENPAYLREPLRYLQAKILQAEKSVYQFVEGQTNLLCLLHEIKTLNVAASWKVRCPNDQRKQDEGRGREEQMLTEDLKEKVKMLESEWQESLGSICEEIKDRVERMVGPEAVPTTPA